MKVEIESVDLFYLREPQIRDVADGSQDALLVRVRAGGYEGWGECEASPLPSIAAWCTPASHGACRPVASALQGFQLRTPTDIRDLNRRVRADSLDVLQAPHTLSGLDTALWDVLARSREVPVTDLLGVQTTHPKTPYASVLFADTPEETEARAERCRAGGFHVAKFGWGPFGSGSLEDDVRHLEAAKAGMGADATVLVDAGTVFGDDVEAAAARLPALESVAAGWLEEPFVGGALASYRALSQRSGGVRLAAGEGATDYHAVEHLVVYGEVDVLQIDVGRIGGLTTARDVALMVRAADREYVNHTFTSNLALAASLAPYWDDPASSMCEYPVGLSSLAEQLTIERLAPGPDGRIHLPEGPGLAVRPDIDVMRRYLVDVQIDVAGQTLYRTPLLD